MPSLTQINNLTYFFVHVQVDIFVEKNKKKFINMFVRIFFIKDRTKDESD